MKDDLSENSGRYSAEYLKHSKFIHNLANKIS